MALLHRAVVCMSVFALPAVAESPLQRLDLAARTAAFARASGDPLALIVAAGLRASVSERLVERQPEHEGAAAAPGDGAEAGDTPASLAAEAVAMSGGDPVIAALAADLAAAARKGLATGVAASRSTVPPGGADWYRGLKFEGGRRAETQIEILGGGDVNLFVYDGRGDLICKDINPSATFFCGWNPPVTAAYTVKLENRGASPVRYKISTN